MTTCPGYLALFDVTNFGGFSSKASFSSVDKFSSRGSNNTGEMSNSSSPVACLTGGGGMYRLSEIVSEFLLSEQECWTLLYLISQEVNIFSLKTKDVGSYEKGVLN